MAQRNLDDLLDDALETLEAQDEQLLADRNKNEAIAEALIAEKTREMNSQNGSELDEPLVQAMMGLMEIIGKGPEGLNSASHHDIEKIHRSLKSTLNVIGNTNGLNSEDSAAIQRCHELMDQIEHQPPQPVGGEKDHPPDMNEKDLQQLQSKWEELMKTDPELMEAMKGSVPQLFPSADEKVPPPPPSITEVTTPPPHPNPEASVVDQEAMATVLDAVFHPHKLRAPFEAMHGAYPDWFHRHRDEKMAPDEFNRYRSQYDVVGRICNLLKDEVLAEVDVTPTADASVVERQRCVLDEFVVLVTELQQYGEPPKDLRR